VAQFSKQWRNIHTSGDRSNGRPTTGTSTKSPGLFTFFVVVVILHRNRKGTGISTKPEKEKKKENNDKIREYPHPELIQKKLFNCKRERKKKKKKLDFLLGKKKSR
jgi:predicted RNase H-like nuclease